MATNIAFLGCGYVADLYKNTISNWPDLLNLKGVFDRDQARLKAFGDHYSVHTYASFEDMLADGEIDIILNLTNPYQHYVTTKACLEAGRHVYVEKPLAMDFGEAKELVKLANEKGLEIGSAPSSVLGESAQTLWKAVRDKIAGTPRLVYAEIDDGLIHKLGYENWKTPYGAQWPAEDEFETGCTLEHAGYMITWLVAMFGPVTKMVSEASLCIPDKGVHTPKNYTTPDFATTTLTHESGMMSRVTMSIVATHDHRLRVFCDDGVLQVNEVWNFLDPVTMTPIHTERWQRGLQKKLGIERMKKLTMARTPVIPSAKNGFPMDFAAGVADMAMALKEGRKPRVNKEFGLHITEVSLAIQHPEIFGNAYDVTTTFDAMEPMPWAK